MSLRLTWDITVYRGREGLAPFLFFSGGGRFWGRLLGAVFRGGGLFGGFFRAGSCVCGFLGGGRGGVLGTIEKIEKKRAGCRKWRTTGGEQ